jgi:hypothetical protein
MRAKDTGLMLLFLSFTIAKAKNLDNSTKKSQ